MGSCQNIMSENLQLLRRVQVEQSKCTIESMVCLEMTEA
jgi:hypothetical protein